MTLPSGYETPFHFDMALLEPVHYMMRRGIRVDTKKKSQFAREYRGQWSYYQEKLNGISGRDLNVNSPKQIKEWLYGDLNLPPRKYKGKLTTREDKLRNLMSKCEEEVKKKKTKEGKDRWLRGLLSIMLILQIRSMRKRISSYIDIEIDPDFRMRTTLSVGGTETGRFSASKTLWDTGCNLQTIPHELREMFIADEGYEIGEFDLNRGESWIYSHLAEDPEMMAIHQEGRDFHSETAAALSREFADQIWSVDDIVRLKNESDEAYKLRYMGKRCNHAFAYRMGPHRAAEVVNSEADETGITVRVGDMKKARRIWHNKYLGVRGWWDEIERELNEDRSLETPYGRRRTFYDHWGSSLFKEATAYVPQSTSVDYLNVGMLRVFHELVSPGKYGLELLHQNHDSIVVQWKEGMRDQAIPAIVECLTSTLEVNGYEISIPIEASYGPSWGSLTEWKEAA